MRYILFFSLIVLFKLSAFATIVYVPNDFTNIQSSIDGTNNNDTIIIMPGIYNESVVINSKSLVISSLYLMTNDTSYISSTIIDGSGGAYVFKINSNTPNNSIIGLTIRNADDGIIPYSKLKVSHNHIYNCIDGIDYEDNSGGICEYNLIYNNSDDALDLDNAVSIDIRNNILKDNADDGIEIRLHTYNGASLNITIEENEIYNNGEDGIQIIGDATTSNRVLKINKNLIYDNSMVGIGSMANMNTIENYLGSNILEKIYITNNTISNNNYGITGSDNMLVINNIIINNTNKGVSSVSGNSLVNYCNFWNNGTDTSSSIVSDSTCIFSNPSLDSDYYPSINSIIIDKGANNYTHNSLVFIYDGNYSGVSVDIGAKEFIDTITSIPNIVDNKNIIIEIYPNPANEYLDVILDNKTSFYCEIYNLTGKLVYSNSISNYKSKISLLPITSGIYLLSVVLENGDRYNKKFVKI